MVLYLFMGIAFSALTGLLVKLFQKAGGGLLWKSLYWIGGIVAFGLLVYLIVALMKPEIFS